MPRQPDSLIEVLRSIKPISNQLRATSQHRQEHGTLCQGFRHLFPAPTVLFRGLGAAKMALWLSISHLAWGSTRVILLCSGTGREEVEKCTISSSSEKSSRCLLVTQGTPTRRLISMHLIKGDKLDPSANGISPSAIPFVVSFHPSILLISSCSKPLGTRLPRCYPMMLMTLCESCRLG